MTDFKDPQPQLRGVTHQFVTYQRKDGVKLSATLYLPPGYKPGTRLPVIMWAYPREFGDADSASQITGSGNRFTTVSGYSHLFLLLSGYAIFDNPTMPIVGPGETAMIITWISLWPAPKQQSTKSSRWVSAIANESVLGATVTVLL